jgi:hypothetical protein
MLNQFKREWLERAIRALVRGAHGRLRGGKWKWWKKLVRIRKPLSIRVRMYIGT